MGIKSVIGIRCIIVFTAGLILSQSTSTFGQASVISGSVSTSKVNYSPGSGNNRLLVVNASNETVDNVRSVTTITWGGQNLVRASFIVNGGSGSNDLRTEIWYLDEAGINAAPAYCNTFIVTWSGGVTTEAFAVYTLKDVDQTTPLATTNGAAPVSNALSVALPSTAVTASSILCYATASQSSNLHFPPVDYVEQSDQSVAATTSLATATGKITTTGNQAPVATLSVSDQLVITAAVFNGVAATAGITYYSRNATLGGAWDDNTSWTTTSNGSGGPLAAGVWPRRHDDVVILPGHTITVNNVADNRSCGMSPDNLRRSNVGPFLSSNTAMFYHQGDLTIRGTFVVTGVEFMMEGYTHLVTGGTFSPTSFLVNTGYLEVDAGTTLTGFNSLVLTGNSVTTINTNSSFVDDLIIDHTDATLCGTGTAQLQNGAGSVVTFTNGGTLNQICSTFTITCTGPGCAGFPVAGSGSGGNTGNTGPGGVGNNIGTSSLAVWLDINRGVTTFFNAVTNWTDQSGHGNQAFQTDDNFRPFFAPNVINGFPTARFYGVNDFLEITNHASIDMTEWSFFLVAKANTHKNFNTFFSKGADGFENFEFLSTVSGSLQSPIYYSHGVRVVEQYGPPAVSDTEFQIYQYDTDNSFISHYTNLAQMHRVITSGLPQVNALPLLLASDGVAGRYLDGEISEYLVYNRKVNLAEQIIINNYLSAKYGLTLSSEIYTMDTPANGNFDYDVAGIGQAVDGSSHRDSRGSGIVQVAVQSPSSMIDGEFFMWGHDGTRLNSHVVAGGDVDGTIIQERLRRVWRVSEVGDVGLVAISFDINSLLTPLGANLRLLVDRDGDGFADNDVTPVGGGTYVGKVITFSGVNLQNGDRFTLGNTDVTIPLPIELLSFTAAAEGNTVKLNWSTASEVNNDYFIIQRSLDAERWVDASRAEGAGNTTTRTDYERTDNNPHMGTSYYRLRQVDLDGKYSYSQIRRVEVTEKLGLKAYPNPVTSGSFHVVTGFEIEPENVQLVDMMGKPLPLKIFKDNEEGVLVETINPSPGVYVLQVAKGYWKQSVRVVIK